MTPFLPLYESYEEGNGENPFCFFAKHMIPTLYEHRKWMKVLYTTAIDPFWSDYLSTFFTQWVVQNLEIDSKKLGIPKEMATEIVVRWINSLIEIWIIKEDPMLVENLIEERIGMEFRRKKKEFDERHALDFRKRLDIRGQNADDLRIRRLFTERLFVE